MMSVKARKGLTLIEGIAATVIFAVLSLLLSTIFLGLWTYFEIGLTQTELAHEASLIFMHLEKDVLEANNLNLIPNGLQIDFPAPFTNPTNNQPFFPGSLPHANVTYQVSGTQMNRITPAGARQLSDHMAAATSFILDNNPSMTTGNLLTVNLILERQVFNHNITYQQTKDLVTRNNQGLW